jgi:hypothetical protein
LPPILYVITYSVLRLPGAAHEPHCGDPKAGIRAGERKPC